MRPIQWLWVGALVALLVVGDVTVYLFVARTLRFRVDRQLSSVALNVVQSMHLTRTSTPDLTQVMLPNLDPFSATGAYVQVVDLAGKGMMQSPALNGEYLTVPAGVLSGSCSSNPTYFNTTFRDQPVRVLTTPLYPMPSIGSGSCGAVGAIQVASPVGDMRHDLGRLRNVLLGFGGAEILLLVSGLWWFRHMNNRQAGNVESIEVAS